MRKLQFAVIQMIVVVALLTQIMHLPVSLMTALVVAFVVAANATGSSDR